MLMVFLLLRHATSLVPLYRLYIVRSSVRAVLHGVFGKFFWPYGTIGLSIVTDF